MYPSSYILGLNKFKDGAWYEPSLGDRITWAIQLLEITSNDIAVDIGSGDGRVVIEMAKRGAKVVGIEKDPELVEISRKNILHSGLADQASIIQDNMWRQSYQSYTKVFFYQFKTIMKRMEQKLLSELPLGSKVVSNYWQFPNWQLTNNLHDIYLYTKQ